MKTLTVELGERSYPIYIGQDLIRKAELFAQHVRGKQIIVVSNTTVAPLYLDSLKTALKDFDLHVHQIPDGESFKNLATLEDIFDKMLSIPCDRTVTLIALGGGVVGDIGGFAAACYQRGVDFIQVPTTLLAQVDSSVGGKTAVNHPLGKNMIGAFHQPRAVIADIETLNTLANNELRAGLAEVVKYGLIRDSQFFYWLEDHMESLLQRQEDALIHAIERSCINKAEIVAADEMEKGQRALLNLGHTFGHAIETATQYKSWLHGEAVATGMLMAADLSQRLGDLDQAAIDRIRDMLQGIGLPITPPAGLGAEKFLRLMAVDKKSIDGLIRLVLLRGIGEAYLSDNYSAEVLQATLENFTR